VSSQRTVSEVDGVCNSAGQDGGDEKETSSPTPAISPGECREDPLEFGGGEAPAPRFKESRDDRLDGRPVIDEGVAHELKHLGTECVGDDVVTTCRVKCSLIGEGTVALNPS